MKTIVFLQNTYISLKVQVMCIISQYSHLLFQYNLPIIHQFNDPIIKNLFLFAVKPIFHHTLLNEAQGQLHFYFTWNY